MIRAAPYCGFTLCSHHISPGSQVQWQDHLIETALYASSSGVVYSNGGNSLSTFGDDGCVGPSCGDLSSSDSCAAFSGGFPSSSGACTELSSDDVSVSSDAGMEFSGGFVVVSSDVDACRAFRFSIASLRLVLPTVRTAGRGWRCFSFSISSDMLWICQMINGLESCKLG